MPQWSPSTEDGTTLQGTETILAGITQPQWSPSTEDGTTGEEGEIEVAGTSRNGARPRRTGRLVFP